MSATDSGESIVHASLRVCESLWMERDAWEPACDVDVHVNDTASCDADDQAATVQSGGEDDFDTLMQRRIHRRRSGRRSRPAMPTLHVQEDENSGPRLGARRRIEASAGGIAAAEYGDVGMQGAGENVGKRRRSGNWIDATLMKAMDAVTDRGMKVKVAARAFNIPASSLKDHLYGKTTSRQRGNLPTLKPDEEKKLVDYIFKMQDLGHPLTLQSCV